MSEHHNILTRKLRNVLAQLPYLPKTLALVWTAARGWTFAWAILLVLQGVLPVGAVYLTRLLVDRLVAAIRAGGNWEAIHATVAPAALIAVILLAMECLRIATSWIRGIQAELVQDHITALIHQKSVAADLAFYDSSEYYDHLHRARSDASYRPVALLDSTGSLVQSGITLGAMLLVLMRYGPWLPVALALSTLPALYVVLRCALNQHLWRQRATANERRAGYYDWLVTAGETAAELRLFGLGASFQTSYQNLRRQIRKERRQLATSQSFAELWAGSIGFLISGAAMAWMVWKAMRGMVTLGDLALFYQAFQQGLRLMRSLLENMGQLYANCLFLGNLFEFLALEPKVIDPPNPVTAPLSLRHGIQFHQVTFRYPGSRRPALQNFNLAIPAGQTVAIVGLNGAGKSTLIKLLCRFYDPQAGGIEIDGIDLRELSIEELRRRITVLFQEPVRYNATVAENIAMGNAAASPGPAGIRAAAKAAGAEEIISHLPSSYDSLLGRRFLEGSELSGGEWQRIALARAFLRQAPITILDEPTSAMDPWAEADWLDRFHAAAAGRTTVIITHRFTTAMRADIIHVMVDGQIVESGNHDKLLSLGGRYAQSWSAQMGYQPA